MNPERCRVCLQPDNAGDCDHTIAPASFAETFRSPYSQYASRRGETFTVERIIMAPDVDHDAEVLPMYGIRFEDGEAIEAWPEEVLVPLPSDKPPAREGIARWRHTATLAQGEAYVATTLTEQDPAGVEAGHYYVDAPEDMLNPPKAWVVENLTQYDLSPEDAATLVRMGFLCAAEDADNPGVELETGELVTTALVWEQLGIEGAAVFELFDAILGRETFDASSIEADPMAAQRRGL